MAKEKEIKEKKTANIFIGLFLIIALGCSGFAIYELLLLSSIETLIRFIVIGIIGVLDLYFITKANRIIKGKIKKKKSVNKGLFITILFIYSIICFLVGGIIFYVYGKIDSLNKNTVTYTSKLLVRNSWWSKESWGIYYSTRNY